MSNTVPVHVQITRTMHFGEPTAHQKACFTRVLQGHIALDSCAP